MCILATNRNIHFQPRYAVKILVIVIKILSVKIKLVRVYCTWQATIPTIFFLRELFKRIRIKKSTGNEYLKITATGSAELF